MSYEMKRFLGVIAATVGLAGMAVLTVWLGNVAFDKLGEVRQLERVPRTTVAAVTGGEVNLSGTSHIRSRTVRGPDTGIQTLYYRYTVEREERDSDGNTSWRTIESATQFVPFDLDDGSGRILVELDRGVRVDATRNHRRRAGNLRYTESRIDPGDEVFLFGFAVPGDDGYSIRFDRSGFFVPILSQGTEIQARQGMATASMAATTGALASLVLGILLLCFILRIHQATVFLGLLTTGVFVALIGWGWAAASLDLGVAGDRVADTRERAGAEIGATLSGHDISWDGDWAALGSFDEARYPSLPAPERARLRRIRMDLERSVRRAEATWTRMPERVIAWRRGLSPPDRIPLPENDEAALAGLDIDYEATALGGLPGGIAKLIGLILAGLFSWLGFRYIALKRLIENVPTSLSTGVAYGLAELEGEVVCAPGSEPLVSPIAEASCVFYHYTVHEKRGSGKNSSWVVIEDRKVGQRFVLRDREGDFPIDPNGAEVLSRARASKTRGRRSYREYRLDVGDDLYALGRTEVDPETGSTLYMCRDDEGPFILGNMSEEEIMLNKAFRGFVSLDLAFVGLLVAALAFAGTAGAFSGLSYLTAALVGPAFLIFTLAVLMYNDLVFLRRRIDLTWANIGVSIRKRADLVPRLQAVLEGYLEHERTVQRQLARIRSRAEGGEDLSREEAADFISEEHRLLGSLRMLRERHPELKASETVTALHDTLVRLENEIALMRDGHNDAVERYNERRAHIPETFIARAFGFEPAKYFRTEVEVVSVPDVLLEVAG